MHASLVSAETDDSKLIEIKTVDATHTCFGNTHASHKQAMSDFIAEAIQAKLQEQPSYRPTDIIKDMRRDHGLQIRYCTAWCAKEAASTTINGSHESAFNKLPQYCQDVIRTNPGSFAIFECTPENHFLRMFISFAASAIGLAHCHPVLGLDGCHLKRRYLGILLTATATDTNGTLFPLAYAVVNAENDDNWLWFCRILHDVFKTHASAFLIPYLEVQVQSRCELGCKGLSRCKKMEMKIFWSGSQSFHHID